jgi:hypothetical protein
MATDRERQLQCCGCGTPVGTDYISHQMTDLPGTDGENWGDTAIMLCEGCYHMTNHLHTAAEFRQFAANRRPASQVTWPPAVSPESPPPWRYEPSGDCDGERFGTDHFVLDGNGDELAVAPDAETGRAMAATLELLASLEGLINACKDLPAFYAGRTPCIELSLAMEAVAKAKGGA